MISQTARRRAVDVAERGLSKIKAEFPALKPDLVLSSREGQTPIGSGLQQMLLEFPAICADTPTNAEAVRLVRTVKILVDNSTTPEQQKERHRAEQRLAALGPEITFRDDIQVELRFPRLLYDQIFVLQTHPLVDQALTPQTRASIRIVLGTLKDLSEGRNDCVADN